MGGGYRPSTKKGYDFGEAASAFQKSIRRGLEDSALFGATELDQSGFGEYVWKRIRIITSEDIGIAWAEGPAVIQALYQTWLQLRSKKDAAHGPERLCLVHAVVLLTRAPKSRIIDHALLSYYNNSAKPEIPDVALDKHTLKGKRIGRGWDHFFNEGTKLVNPQGYAPIPDPYRETAIAAMTKKPSTDPDEESEIPDGPEPTQAGLPGADVPVQLRRQHEQARKIRGKYPDQR